MLGKLVHLTVVNAWNALLAHESRFPCISDAPREQRQRLINGITQRHADVRLPRDLLLSLVTSDLYHVQ